MMIIAESTIWYNIYFVCLFVFCCFFLSRFYASWWTLLEMSWLNVSSSISSRVSLNAIFLFNDSIPLVTKLKTFTTEFRFAYLLQIRVYTHVFLRFWVYVSIHVYCWDVLIIFSFSFQLPGLPSGTFFRGWQWKGASFTGPRPCGDLDLGLKPAYSQRNSIYNYIRRCSFEFQNAFLFEMGLIQDAQTQMLPDQRYTCVVYIRTSFMHLQQCQIILITFKRINEHY